MIEILKKDYAFYLICFFILIVSRLNTSLLNINVLNPDEFQIAAHAIKFKYYGIDLNFFDGYSHGLYNAVILYIPSIFGLEITIFFVRLIGLILIIFSLIFIYKTIKLISNKIIAKFYTIITTFFFSFTRDPDFLSFNAEILFCLIFAISLNVITNLIYKKNFYTNKNFLFIGIFTSSIFFIKLQFALFLVLFFFIIIYFFYKRKINFYNVIFFILGLFLHPIIVLTIFKVDINNFFINNFLRSFDYINQKNEIIFLSKSIDDHFQKKIINPFFYHLKFNLLFHYFYCVFFIFVCFILATRKKNFFKEHSEFLILYSLILLSIIISILIPGRMYRHYLYPLIFLSPIISAYSYNFLKNNTIRKKTYFKILFALIFLLISTSSFLEKKKYYALTNSKILNIDFKQASLKHNLFNYLLNSELKTAFVWGWMPEWYLIGNLSPVTSEATTEHQLKDNKLNKYFSDRTKREIFINQPDLVIDGVRGKSFIYNNPLNNFENFLKKDNNEFLKNYFKISNKFSNKNCPIFYLNNKFKKEFGKIIDVKSIFLKNKKENNSLKNLLDFSITEDTCDDKMLIKKEENSEISIIFNEIEKIDSILILNNKNSMLKKTNSKTVTLKLLNNNENKKILKVELNKYPFWKKIKFEENLDIDRVDFIIENSMSENLSLNEIIFLRK